jgi:hypothetical protein
VAQLSHQRNGLRERWEARFDSTRVEIPSGNAIVTHFSVGEICYLLPSEDWPKNPFCECVVTGAPRLFRASYKSDGSFALFDYLFSFQYEVRDEAGEEWIVEAKWLRKKRPPQNWRRLCRLNDIHESADLVK